MSRLLLLLPSLPVELDSGARIRNHGLLRLLAAEHAVDVIAFGERGTTLDAARGVKVVPSPPGRRLARRIFDMSRSTLPDMALRLWSPAFADAVERALREQDYAAVQAEGIEMAGYLGLVPPGRRVYDAHNAEFLLQRRLAELAVSLPGRLYSNVQWRRLERFESHTVRSSRMTLAVSEHDANQLIALAGPSARVCVVPNAIDVSAYPYVDPTDAQQPNVVFVGTLDFRPNAEGLAWFVENVMPALDETRLFAVGAEPPDWLVAAGQHDTRIAVTGYVPDERPYLGRAMALVLPLRTGGGSRLKALIAMASGLPIVSTRLGMEGLEAEAGKHFLLADSAQEFVGAVARLRADVGVRRDLARRARALVDERYDWSAIAPSLRAAYTWLDE